MLIETLEIAGMQPALRAMRNPMDSWDKSDSTFVTSDNGFFREIRIGKNDKDLSIRLQKAGPEHCKHLRQVMVWADIMAPRYWWNEFDTYRAGVEKVSCSTMHKLMARPLVLDDFEFDGTGDGAIQQMLEAYIILINSRMDLYKKVTVPEQKKELWREVILMLPQSYLQKRTVMMSYAALRNIYRQREGHKLKEWHQFREWVEGLPESWMITE